MSSLETAVNPVRATVIGSAFALLFIVAVDTVDAVDECLPLKALT